MVSPHTGKFGVGDLDRRSPMADEVQKLLRQNFATD